MHEWKNINWGKNKLAFKIKAILLYIRLTYIWFLISHWPHVGWSMGDDQLWPRDHRMPSSDWDASASQCIIQWVHGTLGRGGWWELGALCVSQPLQISTQLCHFSLFQISVTDFEQLICSGSVCYRIAEMQSLSQIIAITESVWNRRSLHPSTVQSLSGHEAAPLYHLTYLTIVVLDRGMAFSLLTHASAIICSRKY